MSDLQALYGAIGRGRGIRAGSWYIIETAQENTLDRICAEVEQSGGVVLNIEEKHAPPVAGRGIITYRRIYLVSVVVPE